MQQLWLAKGCGGRYDISMKKVVTRDLEILGGEPVFAGTRVPIKSLFDHLEAGDSIADFLEGFPSVKREQVLALLEESKSACYGKSVNAHSLGLAHRFS